MVHVIRGCIDIRELVIGWIDIIDQGSARLGEADIHRILRICEGRRTLRRIPLFEGLNPVLVCVGRVRVYLDVNLHLRGVLNRFSA